ncbi:hypothetical protein Tco_0280767 [Tanacetum coccineum]
MALCTNLQNRVLDLEHTKTTQVLEIASLKWRVKKLEKKQRSRTHGLRRLYKGRKIHDIDADEDITLENVYDEDMFDTCVFNDEEVFTGQDMAEKEVSTADPVTTAGEVVTTTNVEVSTVSPTAATIEEKYKLFLQLLEKRRKHFVAKREEERRNRPPTKAQQRSIMCTYLKNMAGWKPKDLKTKSFANVQELFDKAMKRVNISVDMDTELVGGSEVRAEGSETIAQESSLKRAGDELEQDKSKKQKLDEKVEVEVDDAKEAEELKQCLKVVPDDGDDVTIDATPLTVKILIVDYKIYQERKKIFFKIIRADGKTQMYLSFTKMLKNFDRKDLEVL